MFVSGVAAGERMAVWRGSTLEPEPRLRVLLPGRGPSVRKRAATAVFVPSVQQAAKNARKGTASTVRPVVERPGDPTPTEAAWARLRGHPGGTRMEAERARRLGLTGGVTEVAEAMVELGCWRSLVTHLPPGPELVAELAARPDALAPAPLQDPDQALAVAVRAGVAGVGHRVLTGWANAVLDSVIARTRVLSWLQAEQYTDLAMLSRNYPGLHEMLPTEIAMALRTSEAAAGAAISTARVMTQRLPGTLAALHAGLIDDTHAIALARATSTTSPEVTARVETELLPAVTAAGSTLTAEQLRRRAARRVLKLDPDGARERHRLVAADRRITRWAEDDGMAGLKVSAPAEQVAAIWEAATALADAAKYPGDTRPLGARRVDALADVCTDILYGHPTPLPEPCAAPGTHSIASSDSNAGNDATAAQPACVGDMQVVPDPDRTAADPVSDPAPGPGATGGGATGGPDPRPDPAPDPRIDPADTDGTRPAAPAATAGPAISAPAPVPPGHAGRVMHWPTLPARHGRRPHIMIVVPYTVLLGADDPCDLIGHGPITADQARPIIADGVLRRLLCDPVSGTVLDYGRARYEPPESLKQFITARDGTCRTPGCDQPADRCQIDHVEPYKPGQPTGGRTDHTCLDAKCQHHHRAKDGGGFTNTRDPDGTSHWTTPLGRHYERPPNRVSNPDNDDDDQFPTELKTLLGVHNGSQPDAGRSTTGGTTTPDQSAENAEQSDGPPPF